MAITAFGNLAMKVSDLDAAIRFFERAGAPIRDRCAWGQGERVDVELGSVTLTMFTRAVYEDRIPVPDDCFLHMAVFTDDLAADLQGHEILWGPATLSGPFGTRRVAFVAAPGGTRLELMEQLEDPEQLDEAPRSIE